MRNGGELVAAIDLRKEICMSCEVMAQVLVLGLNRLYGLSMNWLWNCNAL